VSDTITLTGGATETIHGTYAASITYVAMMYGTAADTWTALSADNRKRTLAAAVRYLNAQSWISSADTFAERDLIAAFATAQYELAVLIASDPSIVSNLDAGSNIQSVGAGGASVTYFAPTSAGRGATKLPVAVQRLVGSYLAAAQGATTVTAYGSTGSETSPADDCEDYDMNGGQ
jgi:hypothetical protein